MPAARFDTTRGFIVRFPDGTCAKWSADEQGVTDVWIIGEQHDPDHADVAPAIKANERNFWRDRGDARGT